MATVGFNSEGTSKIESAILDYEKRINQGIDTLGENDSWIRAAIKGSSVENQLRGLYKQIRNDLNAYVHGIMTTFETRISKVKSSYQRQDSTSTAISDVTKSIRS